MKKIFVSMLMAGILSAPAFAKNVQVVATTEDLGSLAREIGGDRVSVKSLAPGNADLHFLSARPDYIRHVSKADIFVLIGADMEAGWVPVLLNQSRNGKIQKGQSGYVDASADIQLLEVPTGEINRGMGDVHALGNPHYWLDPMRMIVVAKNIKNALIAADPAGTSVYEENYAAFRSSVAALMQRWMQQLAPYKGKKVMVYHREFNYLAERFGFEIAGEIEPKPGVAPGPADIRRAVEQARAQKIKVILAAPWSNLGAAQKVAADSGARLVVLPIQTGSGKNTVTWKSMMQTVVTMLAEAFAKQ